MAYLVALRKRKRNTGSAAVRVLRTHADGGGKRRRLCQPTKLLGCLRTFERPSSKANPLLVAAVYTAAAKNGDISRVDVKLVDVATGATVARLDRQGNGHFGVTGGLLCLVGTGGTPAVCVFDPATGDVTNIPAYPGSDASSAYVFGHVSETGEHKVLRVYAAGAGGGHGEPGKQACEILTVSGSCRQRWRPAPSPPVRVGTALARHWAVTAGGVAHFLVPQSDVIASFDMKTEEWRPALLRCPVSSDKHHCCSDGLSLVELYGCLVFVRLDYLAYAMDMWLLMDMKKGTWKPVESLPLGKVLRGAGETMVRPLMVLEDGRIAFWVRAPNGVVRVYNPRTGDCEEVANFGRLCSVVGMYRGNLLRVKGECE